MARHPSATAARASWCGHFAEAHSGVASSTKRAFPPPAVWVWRDSLRQSLASWGAPFVLSLCQTAAVPFADGWINCQISAGLGVCARAQEPAAERSRLP
jgi:hypothetical protein